MGNKNKKKPAIAAAPQGGRDIRYVAPPSWDTLPICWHLSLFDHDGPWGSHQFDGESFKGLLLDKIKSFESMTWAQIKQDTGSHFVSVEKITREAQRRLQELRLDDQDDLFSLRCTGRQRLWGIVDRVIMRVLWWDPEHRVCPSFKKNT